jgi:hypothetical protein
MEIVQDNRRQQTLEKIKTILDEQGFPEAIICLKDNEGSSLTPMTEDIGYVLHTATTILHQICGIDEEKIINFYRGVGILIDNAEEAHDAEV